MMWRATRVPDGGTTNPSSFFSIESVDAADAAEQRCQRSTGGFPLAMQDACLNSHGAHTLTESRKFCAASVDYSFMAATTELDLYTQALPGRQRP